MNGVAEATVPRNARPRAQVARLALLDALERAVDGVDEVEVTDVVGAFRLERLAALEQRREARLHDLGDRALLQRRAPR